MKSRVGFNGGAPPTDLLVCFPSRARLTLMPKPIRSPSRPAHHHHSPRPALFRPTNNNHRNNSNSKTRLGSDIGSEPTSPKVTCAGQIKVHRHKKNRDSPKNWLDALGLKKDVMNFIGALRGLRFNMHCFGNFHGAVDCCSDNEEDEELEEEEEHEEVSGSHHARTVFSKCFMVLEENQDHREEEEEEEEQKQEEEEEVKLPPKNALLLMRCRSAPAKGRWEKEEEEEEEVKGEEERMMLMSYAPDFFKVMSTEIAKETWVVGSVDPSMVRSRSWRR